MCSVWFYLPLMVERKKIFFTDLFCDVNLIVDGKLFKLHKSVLAANSDYFWKMFTSIKNENTFVLPGVPLVG